jgi:hypothetical protein
MTNKNSKTSKIVIISASVILVAIIIIVMIMTTQSKQRAAEAAAIAAAESATAAAIPTETATLEATQEPTGTATITPTQTPTMTFTPTLGLNDEGVVIWVIPKTYTFVSISTLSAREDYFDAKVGYEENNLLNVQIPGSYVVIEVHFNQALPEGSKLQFFETGAVTPWLETPLVTGLNDANTGIALITHEYVTNPPYWENQYTVKIVSTDGKIFWEHAVRFFQPLPNTCWDGSLPDPITLYCPNYDGDWNYRDFPNFNPNADIFTSGQVELDEAYK